MAEPFEAGREGPRLLQSSSPVGAAHAAAPAVAPAAPAPSPALAPAPGAPRRVSILMLEDDVLDAELVCGQLAGDGVECDVKRVDTREEFAAALASEAYDLVLADHALPAFDGLSALAMVRERRPDLPFIFVSGRMGEQVAIDSLKRGATDYVLKDHLERLGPAVARALAEADERRARRLAEERAGAILESITDGFFAVDQDWRLTYLNRRAEALLGRRAGELLGKVLWDEYPGLRGSEFERAYRRAAAGRAPESATAYYPDHNRWYECHAYPAAGGGLCVYFRDVTDRRRAEEQLRRSHETFYRLIENDPFGVLVVDAEFRLRQVSRGARQVFAGVDPLLGRDFAGLLRTVWPEPFAGEVIARFRHTLETGEPFVATGTVERRKDRAEVEAYDWRIERVALPDGRSGVVCYFYDLSERQRWEAALEASEARHSAALAVAHLGTFEWDVRTGAVALDERSREIFGFAPDEGARVEEVFARIHPDDLPRVAAEAEASRENLRRLETEYRVRLPDGAVRTVVSINDAVAGADGRAGRMLGVFADVTDRRRAEAEAAPLAAMVRASRDGMFMVGADAIIRAWNPGAQAVFGYTAAEAIGMPLSALVPPERGDEPRQLLGRVIRGERVPETETVRVRKDGSPVDVSITLDPVADAAGRVVGAVATARDVTERNRSRAALRESEERLARQARLFERIASSTPDFIYVFDLRGRFLYANRRLLEVWGRTFEEAVGRDLYELGYPRWHADMHVRELRQVIETKQPVKGEVSFTGGSGISGVYEYIFTPVLAPDGAVEVIAGTTRDVTERKRAEKELEAAKAAAEANLARWRAVVDSMADGVVVADAAGNLPEWNAAALRMHEYASLEEVRRNLSEFPKEIELTDAGGRVVPLAQWPMSRVLRGESFSGYELAMRRLDADVRRVIRYGGSPVRDRDGKIVLAVLTLHDVTEERRARAAVRDSEARLRLTTDALPVLISYVDAGHVYRFNNAAYSEWFGTDAGELTGRHVRDVLGEETYRRRLGYIGRALAGERVRFEEMMPHRAKGPRDTETSYVPDVAEDGRTVRGFVSLVYDITGRREVERERERLLAAERAARAEAERASRMKDEFLATLSHELRTPLNAILGWAQILRAPGTGLGAGGAGGVEGDPGTGAAGGAIDAEDLRQGLETIERNARAQTRIIEDLLDMSRIISGKVRLDVQRVPLAPVIEAAVETVRHAAEAKGLQLQVQLDPSAGPVSGDPARLQQVFWNLLSNSVKHTGRGGRVRVQLARRAPLAGLTGLAGPARLNRLGAPPEDVGAVEAVKAVEALEAVEVSVSDDGEGIAPEFLPHVFDRFRQADSSTTRRHGGLGLGLSIVKQLVELHGGAVRAESAGVGRGATFTVTLPLTPAPLEPRPEAGPRLPRLGPGPGGAAQAALDALDACVDLRGVRVLVVDDEPDARALVKRLLEDCKAVVSSAGSAAEGLDAFRRERPEVLVSDIAMEGEDGYSLIRRVRALPPAEGGDTPAVALTAYARSEDRTRALLSGFQSHLSKPVEPAELVATVASLARRTGRGGRT